MSNLYKVMDTVKEVLIENKESQNNDFILYRDVCKKINPAFLSLTFNMAMNEANYMNMPPFESVRRSRQLLQKKAPILYGVYIPNRKKSLKKQEQYKEFARL